MKQDDEPERSWQERGLEISRVAFYIPVFVGAGLIVSKIVGLTNPSYSLPWWLKYLPGALAVTAMKVFEAKYDALERKRNAVGALEVMERDDRPPVLYLRSFKDDDDASRGIVNYTVEEDLAEVLKELGPVVTVGRPGEEVPQPGAARMYVAPDEWQTAVTDLMLKSRLVVLRIGDTDGFWWEVQRAAQLLEPERLVLIAFDRKADKAFRRRATLYLSGMLAPPKGSKGWVLYFEPGWIPHFNGLSLRFGDSFRYETERGMVPTLKTSLRPVFTQLGARWELPPIRWSQVLLTVGGTALLLYGALYFFVLK
jgi:hypothetical protein